MKKLLLVVGIIAILVTTSNSLNAENLDSVKNNDVVVKESIAREDIKEPFTKNYDHDDLLLILAEIQDDLENKDLEAAKSKSDDILGYLNYHKNIANNNDNTANNNYSGREVLELKYGNWYNPKLVVLPFRNLDNKRISYDSLKENIDLSNFRVNQINRAKIKYVTYDLKNETISKDIYNLLASLGQGDESDITKNIENIYENLFRDQDSKISLVSEVRDNLTLARHLIANRQFKAADNTVGTIDSLTLRLIELTAGNQNEQKRIKNLRKELNNIAKISDENYISQWKAVPEEIGDEKNSK